MTTETAIGFETTKGVEGAKQLTQLCQSGTEVTVRDRVVLAARVRYGPADTAPWIGLVRGYLTANVAPRWLLGGVETALAVPHLAARLPDGADGLPQRPRRRGL